MKKLVIIARIIFWTAFVVFMVTLFERGSLLTFLPQDSIAFIMWASGFLMFVSFQMLDIVSVPVPKIHKNQRYVFMGAASNKEGGITVILRSDKDIELHKGEQILAAFGPIVGNSYFIEIMNGNIYFT